jgi:bzd-type benzoyl-CoA reductase N subunit
MEMTSLAKLLLEADEIPYNSAIKHWKSQEKKVIGWLCTYTPEEVIYAAGILPIRIYGNPERSSLGDAYLQPNTCPYARSCMGSAIEKEYHFLDGIVATHTCDAICRLYDLWDLYAPLPFRYIMDSPHKLAPSAHKYHLQQLKRLIKALETFVNIQITEEDLNRSFQVYQENRTLLMALYQLRKKNHATVRASEVLKIIKASTVMPKEEHNKLLQEALVELETKESSSTEKKIRLVVSGSIMNDAALLELIEECGGLVVSDDLCVGTRYFWPGSPTGNDTLTNISQFYLEKIPCACIHPPERRLHHIMHMVKEFSAQGVILYSLIFCDTFAYDFVLFKKKLEEARIPVLLLTLEHPSLGVGQVRTRIEAFLEMLDQPTLGIPNK